MQSQLRDCDGDHTRGDARYNNAFSLLDRGPAVATTEAHWLVEGDYRRNTRRENKKRLRLLKLGTKLDCGVEESCTI